MAKVNKKTNRQTCLPAGKENLKTKKQVKFKPEKKIQSKVIWQENQIHRIQTILEPVSARAGRYGALAGISVLLSLTLYSIFVPKSRFDLAREKILKNPNDLEAHMVLTEEFLASNQIKEAGKELTIIESLETNNLASAENSQVLGLSSKLEQLRTDYQEANPEELQKLIGKWNEVVSETPTYRDGWIRLAYYHYRLGEKEQAKMALAKAVEIDPYFETTKELQEVIN